MLHFGNNKSHSDEEEPDFMNAKLAFEKDAKRKKIIIDLFLIFCGVFCAGFGLKGFLMPSNFIDGGTMGLSLLATEVFKINLSLLIIVINAPFIILGKKIINNEFAFKSAFAIAALAFWVAIFPYPHITNDKLLISVFGGFFLGAGVGLTMRGGAVIDGTEVLAIEMSKRTGLSIGDVILCINIIIFSIAAWVISVETALYAMLTYLAASKTVDFLIEGIEEYAFKLEVSGLDSRIVSFNRLISASIERCRIASVEEQLKMFESCRYYFTNSTSILQQERK
jgi:uncharacterized membrane-anchored protein YitT (DUF2179 family)